MKSKYNLIEVLLHKLALSGKTQFQSALYLENIIQNNKNDYTFESGNHLFICGMARSGTTMLLNIFYKTNLFSSITYRDMPFIACPNIWKSISSQSKKKIKAAERLHNDGVIFDNTSPEAFEEAYWINFQDHPKQIDMFKKFVLNYLIKDQKKNYLSKNNQNIKRIPKILNSFPNSKMLILFRDPFEVASSIFFQHKSFINLQKESVFIKDYMKMIGHSEFGSTYQEIYNPDKLLFRDSMDINHWLEQWILIYTQIIKEQTLFPKRMKLVSYNKLCNDFNPYMRSIFNFAKIDKNLDFEIFHKNQKFYNESSFDKSLSAAAKKLFNEMEDLIEY
jgi:hypothetical protein